MNRTTPWELLLVNLEGRLHTRRGYVRKEAALFILEQITGQDFGYDTTAWRQWGAQQPEIDLILRKRKEIPHYEWLLFHLAGEILRAKTDARKTLKRATGQDFGDDVEAWRTWLQENGKLKGKT